MVLTSTAALVVGVILAATLAIQSILVLWDVFFRRGPAQVPRGARPLRRQEAVALVEPHLAVRRLHRQPADQLDSVAD